MAKVNVAVFKSIDNVLEYAGGSFTGDGPLVLTKLTANRLGRVRSHFERVLPVEELEHLQEAANADRARQDAEKRVAAERKREELKIREEEQVTRRQEENAVASRQEDVEDMKEDSLILLLVAMYRNHANEAQAPERNLS